MTRGVLYPWGLPPTWRGEWKGEAWGLPSAPRPQESQEGPLGDPSDRMPINKED